MENANEYPKNTIIMDFLSMDFLTNAFRALRFSSEKSSGNLEFSREVNKVWP